MRLLPLLAVLAACSSSVPGYAPVKKNLCADCSRAKFPFETPRQGAVLDYGGSMASSGLYEVIDLGGLTVERVVTRDEKGSRKVSSRDKKLITKEHRDRLVEVLNRAWAQDGAVPAHPTNDAGWELTLLDGDAVRVEKGSGSSGF